MLLKIQLLNTPYHTHPAHLTDGWSIPFTSSVMTVGRVDYNEFVLPFSTISSVHARIFYHNRTLYLEDLDSTNGTYVNGQLIEKGVVVTLQKGDRIQFGNIVLMLDLILMVRIHRTPVPQTTKLVVKQAIDAYFPNQQQTEHTLQKRIQDPAQAPTASMKSMQEGLVPIHRPKSPQSTQTTPGSAPAFVASYIPQTPQQEPPQQESPTATSDPFVSKSTTEPLPPTCAIEPEKELLEQIHKITTLPPSRALELELPSTETGVRRANNLPPTQDINTHSEEIRKFMDSLPPTCALELQLPTEAAQKTSSAKKQPSKASQAPTAILPAMRIRSSQSNTELPTAKSTS